MFIQILLTLAVILPGLIVVIGRKPSVMRISFFLISVFLAMWSLTNYLVDFDEGRSLLWARTTFFFIVWAAASFLLFTLHYPKKITKNNRYIGYLLIGAAILSVLVYTPLFISAGHVDETGVFNIDSGPLYLAFVIYYVVVFVVASLQLLRQLRHANRQNKPRIKVVVFSILAMTAIATTTNLILPSIFHYSLLSPYGGYATILFTGGVAYAIARHRLFSVRPMVARATAYGLTVVVVTVIYFGSISIVSTLLVSRQSFNWTEILIYFSLSLFLAANFQWFLGIFTKITQRIFYRSAYDAQEVIERVGKVLESEIRLDTLIQNALNEVCGTIHITHGQLAVIDGSRLFSMALFGSTSKEPITSTAQLEHLNQKIVVADDLDSGIRLDVLEKHGFQLSLMLHTQDERIGYLLLGDKLNGDTYSDKDIKLLEIIARDISVSIQNAKSYEEIALFNETLQARIKQATQELQRTNEKLKALDEAKDEFVSMASHQLRTPLTSIKGYISMVLEGDAGEVNEQQQQFLQQAFASSQRMVYLISDLLNVSRLKTGTFVVERKETYLPDIVEAEVSQLVETAKSRGIELAYTKPTDFPKMMLDETKIRQVIMNFTDNAIYYTPKGGKIMVSLIEKPRSLELTVTDSGIGVPKSEQHKLFTKFYRADNARKARPDGTGLGLYMAKKVISAQGGAIIFRSQEGKGSTFGFSFPHAKLETEQ